MDVYRGGTDGADVILDFGAAGKVVLQQQFAAGTTLPASHFEFVALEDEPGLKLALANNLDGAGRPSPS